MNLTLEAIGSWLKAPSAANRRRNKRNRAVAAEINVLETRAMLASDISGTWYNANQPTSIQQSGNELIFTNEDGQSVTGRFTSGTQVVADQWGGLTGTIAGDRINWANNSVWTRTVQTYPNISGTWYFGNLATSISQSGQNITFTNEQGVSAQGRFLTSTDVIADGWDGLRGTIATNGTISWANGDTWSRTQGPTNPANPTLGSTWVSASNGGTARVAYDVNGGLTFTNVAGVRSGGYFIDATHVYASSWGITGTLNSSTNPTRITWSNGSVWNIGPASTTPSNPPLAANWIAVASGRSTQISSDGHGGLIFTNAAGVRSYGLFSNSSQVYASDWGITGILNSSTNPTRITWSNGSVWTAVA